MVVAFYSGKQPGRINLGAWAVRTFTRSPWGHCAVLDFNALTEATVTGVRERVFGPSYAQYALADKEATLVPIPGETPAGQVLAQEFLAEQIGKPYDKLGIVLDVVGKFVHLPRFVTDQTRKRWTCSRLAAFACALAGWDGPAWPIPATPGGLYDALKRTRH